MLTVELIEHFKVISLVTWPLNGSEAGVEFELSKDLAACIVEIRFFYD